MRVLDLLSTGKQWTKFTDAKTANGRRVEANDPKACQFCLSGAVDKCYPTLKARHKAMTKLSKVIEKLYGDVYGSGLMGLNVISFNDSYKTTFRRVRRVVREAGV